MAAQVDNVPASVEQPPELEQEADLPRLESLGGRTGGEPTHREADPSPVDYSAVMGSLPLSEQGEDQPDAPPAAQSFDRGETSTIEMLGDQTTLADFVPLEGIASRINEILHDAGITTYSMLAEMDVERLRYILETAGLPHADPTSWPEQARLAADGDWDGLEALKKDMKTRSI